MKQIIQISFLLFIVGLISSCKKKCDLSTPTNVATSSEIATIQSHLSSNGLTATQHSSGIFYSITKAGTGSSPDMCSNVSVQYVGTLLNGSKFDESITTITFALNNLIVGWQIGIPLIEKGGEIKLYIPPSLAYGSIAQNGIPANSTLIFDIKLIAFQSNN